MADLAEDLNKIVENLDKNKEEKEKPRAKIVACMDQMITSQCVWQVSKAFANFDQKDQVCVYHFSPGFHNRFAQSIRERFFHFAKKYPNHYQFELEYKKANQAMPLLRTPLMSFLRENEPQFIVAGLELGLSSQLLGDMQDVSFRQASFVTPIIVKQDIFIPDPHATWAIMIDHTEDAQHAFDTVLGHINEGDKVHLLYPRPPATINEFVVDDTGGKYLFMPFKTDIQRKVQNVQIQTHVLDEPNVGMALCAFVNGNKKRHVHYLVVYCDLMREYIAQKGLMGSVSDHCARHAQCSVIVPRFIPR